MSVHYDEIELAMLCNGKDPAQGEQPDRDDLALVAGHRRYSRGAIMLGALGAIRETFDAAAVWADVQAGGAPYTPGTAEYAVCNKPGGLTAAETADCNAIKGAANFRGARATQQIREALNELGYGPLVYGVPWSEGNPGAAYKRFLADHGMAPGPGLGVTRQGLEALQAVLRGEEDTLPPTGKGGKKLPWWAWGLIAAGGAGAVYAVYKYS